MKNNNSTKEFFSYFIIKNQVVTSCQYHSTIVVNHLNSTRSFKLKDNPLHILLDSSTDEILINKSWTTYGKLSNIVNPTT